MQETKQPQPNDIGVGILTYNRRDQFWTVFQNFKKVFDKTPFDCVVVNDGAEPYASQLDLASVIPADHLTIIENNESKCISYSKNQILKQFIEQGKEHIFIFEDDVNPLADNVLEQYINASRKTGILHFNFCCTRGKNILQHRKKIAGVLIDFYKNPEAGMLYYNGNLFRFISTFDEAYNNAFEHVDLEYQLHKRTLAPPFWYFPDLSNSYDLLEYLDCDSTLLYTGKDNNNWKLGASVFIKKHGVFTNQIPMVSVAEVDNVLAHLHTHYRRE